jgi:decaprenylphospho-beta-D-erythro-pentofuranosid-2-ulose 2-reductase
MNDVTGMPQTAVVIGGGSDIARQILRSLAGRRLGAVVLAGRGEESLAAGAAELHALDVATVETAIVDVTDIGSLEAFADDAAKRLGAIDLVLVAAGELGTAELDALDAASVAALASANFTGPAAATMAFARVLRAQGHGKIVVLSSVAGVRVRAANFVYGAAKAGLDGFCLGLADALAGSGVGVMVVRPGFVKTKMTAGRKSAPFTVEASDVADAVVRGLETGKSVVWVPGVLRYVFVVLRLVPGAIWRRMPA